MDSNVGSLSNLHATISVYKVNCLLLKTDDKKVAPANINCFIVNECKVALVQV